MLRLSQNVRGSHGRARFAEGRFERVNDAQGPKSKIAHRAGCRANVQGVARGNQDYVQAFELSQGSQEAPFYRAAGRKGERDRLFARSGRTTFIRVSVCGSVSSMNQ